MRTYSPEAIAEALHALPEDDSARAAMRKAANLPNVAPSDVHELHAATYSALTGIEVDPKLVQIVLSLHGAVQRSELNRSRETYRGRTAASLRKGAETLQESLASVAPDAPGAIAARRNVVAEVETPAPTEVETPKDEDTAPTPTPKRRRRTPAKSATATAAK